MKFIEFDIDGGLLPSGMNWSNGLMNGRGSHIKPFIGHILEHFPCLPVPAGHEHMSDNREIPGKTRLSDWIVFLNQADAEWLAQSFEVHDYIAQSPFSHWQTVVHHPHRIIPSHFYGVRFIYDIERQFSIEYRGADYKETPIVSLGSALVIDRTGKFIAKMNKILGEN